MTPYTSSEKGPACWTLLLHSVCYLSYLRFNIQPINTPAAIPTANVTVIVSIGCRCRRLTVSSKKLFSSVAALFCDTPGCSYAILKCIRNSRCRPRSLARRFGNLLARLFQH